ncbi:uncharacterized protein DEA37_0007614 [Paragonimus westermani]|uniref:Uncharacterized protein n=1 Tax=Paragonimus westermani TaxID=34504 RepID=A0A5J4NZ22_9TREM|nr:uncharacterized protein DEA37_0007614 [Paragonimus westermani]
MPEDQHSLYLKLAESLIQDYRTIISESRRKFVPIKDAAEKQITWLRTHMNGHEDLKLCLLTNTSLIDPFLNGCATKQLKIVSICLSSFQKLISRECLSEGGAQSLIDVLWALVDANVEEVRVLQTTILLLTSSSLVHGDMLAKVLVFFCVDLCSLLNDETPTWISGITHFSRSLGLELVEALISTYSVLFRQSLTNPALFFLVYLSVRLEEISSANTAELSPTVMDAYRLFQDLCSLLNDETPTWISGITHFSRSLGLELVEALISTYSVLFRQHNTFAYLLKTSLCPLVIKLFSPSLKLRSTPSGTSSRSTDVTSTVASTTVVQTSGVASGSAITVNPSSVTNAVEKISFPIVVRLKRLITVIVEQYFHLLNTECEIYLSVLIRFLDVDKTAWQRALALEVLQKFSSQPDLIRRMCISYDMRQHSTKIFSELIGALSHYVQAVLANPSPGDELVKETNQSSVVTSVPGPNQSLLYYKGSFFPILQPKSFLVDLLDRSDAPNLQEGYCLSLAFGCLLRIVNSLDTAINHSTTEEIHPIADMTAVGTSVQEQFIVLSWCGLLAAFALLLEASADEQITASLLQAIHTMVGLCGKLRVDAARDSFVTTLCKAALPSSYARSMFSGGQTKGLQSGSSTAHEEVFERSPVAIVVTQGAGHSIQVTAKPTYGTTMGTQSSTGSTIATSLATTSESHSVSPGGSLLLTVKHLQATRSVLFAASVHGNVLGNSWNIILGTLQNLVWMLGLKIEPAAHLYFKPSNTCASSISSTPDVGPPPQTVLSAQGQQAGVSVVPSPVLNDLTSLSAMLANLFAQSSNLDVAALNDLVLGLCHLSSEAIEAASVNKPASHFPVAKLTEVGLVNIDRLNIWWDNVCCQLLTMCKLQNTDLRQLAANSLVALVKQAMAAPQTPTFWKNEALTNVVLDPLSALSEVPFDDVREKQLECVQHMLHCWGEHIGTSWLRLIEIIGVIRDSFKVDLIQTAFQCFKLIVTDYMTSLLFNCYAACVETAARFGRQQQDLNIALTAIGTILHLADHVFQLEQYPSELGQAVSMSLPELWIEIFRKLAELCLDRRPAIRKSACQTLFNTVECHAARRFTKATWSDLFWQVLFPLVSKVHEFCANAPIEREGRQNSLLIHHSRDTAAKQWAETVVLTLSGVAHLFVSRQEQLLVLDEFPKVWLAVLDQIKQHALTNSAEISVSALTALQILLDVQVTQMEQDPSCLWSPAWETWLQIGCQAIKLHGLPPANGVQDTISNESEGQDGQSVVTKNGLCAKNTSSTLFLPTTSFMTLLFDLFPPLFRRTRAHFTESDFRRLDKIVRLGVLMPLHVSYLYPQSNFTLLPVIDDGVLSALQTSVIRSLELLIQTMQPSDSELHSHLPSLMHLLLALAGYAVHVPKPDQCGPGRDGGMRLLSELTKLLQTIWETEEVPRDWCLSTVIPVFKKGSRSLCDNHRGISLVSVASTVVIGLILRRLTKPRESQIREEQAGFRSGRGCVDHIYPLRRILEHRHSYRQPTAVVFLDLRAAFDSVARNVLWSCLLRKGVPEKYVNLLRSLERDLSSLFCGVERNWLYIFKSLYMLDQH